MSIEAKIIADSISPGGVRLTTMQVKYQRFIIPEMNTHRVFSRSYSSSRAIPAAKLIEQVRNDPAMPIRFGKNKPGMQAAEDLSGEDLREAQELWIKAANIAADLCEEMAEKGVHKQICNRIVEPYLWVHGVISSTEWDNFYNLRCHPDAQPEFQFLAVTMREVQNASTPKLLEVGEWHLPYLSEDEKLKLDPLIARMCSSARCARVSYLRHDGETPSIDDDVALFNRLAGSDPKHLSPLEHVATPQADSYFWGGNFRGWQQFRSDISDS